MLKLHSVIHPEARKRSFSVRIQEHFQEDRKDLQFAQPSFLKIRAKSRTEELVVEERGTFFFEPAFARRSLMVDFADESSDYEPSSDCESGIMFASISDFGDLEIEVES